MSSESAQILRFVIFFMFFFSSRRRHTRYIGDWSSDVCSSDLQHEDATFAATDVEEGVVLDAAGKRLLPLFEDSAEARGSGSPVGIDVVVVRVPGGQVFGEEQAAGIDSVFEIERGGGDRGREKLAVQPLAEDPDGAPRAVGAKSIAEALDRRRGSHIGIIREPLRIRKEAVKKNLPLHTLRKSFLRQRSQLGRKQTAVNARAKATEVRLVEAWRGKRGGKGPEHAGEGAGG